MGIKAIIKNKVMSAYVVGTGNTFLKDYWEYCHRYRCEYTIRLLLNKYKDKIGSINKYLYEPLTSKDKDTFMRWLIKRWFYVDTVTTTEADTIKDAFEKTKQLYSDNNDADLIIEFRNKKVFYPRKKMSYSLNTDMENNLMNYYDAAHAFFLVEYEMEGFNPTGDSIIFDCGAARGDTLLMFKCMYPDSTVYSFEMNPNNLEDITRVIKRNQLENIHIVNKYLYRDSKQHSIDKEGKIVDGQSSEADIIQTISIDDFCESQGITRVDLIKFDIEGGELDALNGAIKTIKRHKPLLYIPIYHLESDIYSIPEFLNGLGMKMSFRLKWTEKMVWGMDCVLFVKFEEE